ncbi:MAG: hypothetical protein MJB14_00090 [Spirochaetes bacterium]|nr:hypothetical protein [Spirochaetota bacterium]
MNRKIIIFLIFIIPCSLFSQKFISLDRSGKLLFGLGIAYNFNISQDLVERYDPVFLEVPFKINFDLRVHHRLSLLFGVNVVYGYHQYLYLEETFHKQNLYIRIPVIFKIYPFSQSQQRYYNVYIGLGIFAHFWLLNWYHYKDENGAQYYGNAYKTEDSLLYPGDIYTKYNVGISLAMGNHFYIGKRAIFGIELFSNFICLPFWNGYFNTPDFYINDHVMLNFQVNVGIGVSIGLELFKF